MATQTNFSPSARYPLRIGTRGSPLALAQARELRQALMKAHGLEEGCFVIEVIRTSGDRLQNVALSAAGGKALFTKEIEDKLLAGEIDLAVHSAKDVPTRLPAGLELAAFLPRQDVRDAFISPKSSALQDLPPGASVGTISLRRQALVRRLRPDLAPVSFRGNIDTRLKKLSEGVVDAVLLAAAGLNRLGLAGKITSLLPVDAFLPAIGQGAVALEVHEQAKGLKEWLKAVNHRPTALCVSAERAFLDVLDGSCRTPIAGHARFEGGELVFCGRVLSIDGLESFSVEAKETIHDLASAKKIGQGAGRSLRKKAGEAFLSTLVEASQSMDTTPPL